jgi:pimeloyl-ACP methyl ester carboxylesterase
VPTSDPRAPELVYREARGLRFAVWEWPGADPPLLFAHATSFHGRIWDQIVREFPAQRCLAIEARGHGRTSQPPPPYHWHEFGADLAVLAEGLGLTGAIGIGHSMGGHTLVSLAASRPSTLSALLLIDPTIRPPELYGAPAMDVSFVRKRRNHFQSADDMFRLYHNRPPFHAWSAAVFRDYCDFGLLPQEAAFRLACPPNVEASIYECSKEAEANLHPVLPSVLQPTVVLRTGYVGDRPFSQSPTDPHLAARLPHGSDVLLASHTHFIPMEDPDLIAHHIRELLACRPGERC